jgi:hypothetical protein
VSNLMVLKITPILTTLIRVLGPSPERRLLCIIDPSEYLTLNWDWDSGSIKYVYTVYTLITLKVARIKPNRT